MALVKSFIVEAGCISSPAFSAYRVSPRERETTIAPHIPLRVFAVSPLKMDATSAELFSTVYRTTGTGGGRLGFRRRTLRRVVVALFLVWASMIGGAAPHTVSATRMAILIFRECIDPFLDLRLSATLRSRSDGEKGATARARNISLLLTCESLGIYPQRRYFPRIHRRTTASGE